MKKRPDQPEPRSITVNKRHVGIAALVAAGVTAAAALSVSWFRPYDRPEYADIDTSESAFLIPLEGDTSNQSSFQSAQFLEQKKVAAKRVQITHRWNQTGFNPHQGEWIPAVRLVKVDRRPVTREWTKAHHTGTSTRDEALAAESRDSVNFTMGVSCTANIPEELASVFLYSYPSKSLADMMDGEVRARIQQVVAEEAGKHNLEELRFKKNEIMAAVKADVVPFFKGKGIEITTVAMLGGLTYDNPEIQKAIDDAVKTSQLKVAAESRREAQEVDNKTTRLAAEGRALAAKLEAQAKAEADVARAEAEAKVRVRAAEAEAEAIRTVAEARAYEAEKAGASPETYLRLRTLEAEAQRFKQWDGKYPAYLMQLGGAGGPSNLHVQLPTPPEAARDVVKK
jgi:regulator of protease activity HflC (stomatin/prohibitin superfamily)